MISIDENDPCAAVTILRSVYTNLVAGQAAARISFRAGPNGVQREQEFHPANPDRLLMLIREYEAKCQAANGGRPTRFAMRAGGWT